MAKEKEKTVYDLKLHETLTVIVEKEEGEDKTMEVTRVPGGWVYTFEFPGWRQSPIVFVPFSDEIKKITKK